MRRLLLALTSAAAASVVLSAADAPKLVVLMVVDQMRADYVERFRSDWSGGLRRLVDEGAWFTRAAYPYLNTVTCAGHATLGTGAYPHVHGIIGNTWFDRQRSAVIPCTEDAQASVVAYGRGGNGRFGPSALMVPTLAEQMRSKGAKVVTLALKARSAIMMAGHSGDAVTWVSESLEGWETSTKYTAAPVPQVSSYVTAHPMSADFGKIWNRLLPPTQYRDTDDGLGEDPAKGWSPLFPHVLKGLTTGTSADPVFYDQWQHSPFADGYVARMAAALTESFQLGKHSSPDFLGVSFSSPDLVGHSYGPRSQEVEDMYAHLDRSIGGLLEALDRLVGTGSYVVALSADHGVTEIPEQLKIAGRDGGRISSRALISVGNSTASRFLGLGDYLDRVNGNEVYFRPRMYDKVRAVPKALESIIADMSKQPGIKRVFTSDEIAHAGNAADPELRAAALSYVRGRSGDLVVSPKPGWMFTSAGTTHGSANPNDQRVPILLFGAGIKPGQYDNEASPADVAPTLAALIDMTLPKAEGRPLREALR
jgi:predicted AlkP superfamily pyrophosphatase or phosphodiesterase